MALVKKDIEYLDENKIGNQGYLHISKAHWPNLQRISLGKEDIKYLGGSQISDDGCSNLSKAHWPKL